MKHTYTFLEYIKENFTELDLKDDIINMLNSTISNLKNSTSGNISHQKPNLIGIFKGSIDLIDELNINQNIKEESQKILNYILFKLHRINVKKLKQDLFEIADLAQDVIDVLNELPRH